MCKWRMSSWIWTLSPDGPSRETAFFSAKNISKVAINSKMQWERNQKMSQFPDPKWNLLNWFSDSRVNYHLWKVILLSYLARNVTQFPQGVLPYKSGGGALRKISRTAIRNFLDNSRKFNFCNRLILKLLHFFSIKKILKMYFLFFKDNLFLERLNSFDQGGPAARSGTEFTWSPQF